MVAWNSTSVGFVYIWQGKLVGIIAIKTLTLLSDVLVAVAVLYLKVPTNNATLLDVYHAEELASDLNSLLTKLCEKHIFQSVTQAGGSEEKTWVLPIGFQPMILWLLVQMLHHRATRDLWKASKTGSECRYTIMCVWAHWWKCDGKWIKEKDVFKSVTRRV